MKKIHRPFKKLLLILIFTAIIYSFLDFRGAKTIPLKNDTVFGFNVLRAKDLIVQEFDSDGTLWASRGMVIYSLAKNDDKFIRQAHVPTGFSIFWLRNFTLMRRLTIRPECIEFTVQNDGDIYAVSGGRIWLRKADQSKFHPMHELKHYGFGDQGVRNCGIMNVGDSIIFIGQYFQNAERKPVKIMKSTDASDKWEAQYVFPGGEIRHIHALQEDPYSNYHYILTGDEDNESKILFSNDSMVSFQVLGEGSQLWRVCQMVFTQNAFYWGTDTGVEKVAGLYKYSKETKTIERLAKIDGAMFYGTQLAGGTVVMSTNREGWKIEKDDKTRLYIIPEDGDLTVVEGGTWKHNKPGFWFKFAKLRFQRHQGSDRLAISVLNQKELRDGDLIIIKEEELLSRVK